MDAQRLVRISAQIAVFVAFFAAWEFFVRATGIKPVILPPPSLIFATAVKQWHYLLMHAVPTTIAIVGGFLIAAISGFLIAVGIAYSRLVNEIVYPFLIVSQVLPKIALAPLFLIWFGFGIAPKLVIAALIAFFPIVVNTARGLSSVEPELVQYMRSLGASSLRSRFRSHCLSSGSWSASSSRPTQASAMSSNTPTFRSTRR